MPGMDAYAKNKRKFRNAKFVFDSHNLKGTKRMNRTTKT